MTHEPRRTRTERREVITERSNPGAMVAAVILAILAIAIAVWAFSDNDASTTGTTTQPGQTTVPAATSAPTETSAPAITTTVAP